MTLNSSASCRFFIAFRSLVSAGHAQPHRTVRISRTANLHKSTWREFSASRSTLQRESLTPQTHFDLFPKTIPNGPPPTGTFDIDLAQLKKEFLQLQAKAHPDRHAGPDKARAEGASMRINEAYKTLQDPLRRAQYLLSLRGIDVADDETLKIEDPELLMEVLEMREQIEEIQEEEDLQPLKEVNNKKMLQSITVLENAFKSDDIGGAKQEAVKLRYWVNIKESLDAWEKGKPVILVH